MEFDKSKILTVLTGSKELEGKAGWLGDTPTELMEKIKKQDPEHLLRFDETCACPFEGEDWNHILFYPAPEPTYAERQAEWVIENNVTAGTKVRVTRTFTKNEDGSYCWEHDDLVGMTGSICEYGIGTHNLRVTMSDGYSRAIPYFVLEVIKEPTYRPYNNDELNDLVGKVLIQKNTGNAMMAIKAMDREVGKLISLGGSQKRNAQQLLDGWTHKNGEPCGVKESDV